MRRVALLGCVLLAACAAGDDSADTDTAADSIIAAPDTMPVVTTPAAAINPVIRSDGIGAARIGMRISELRQALEPGLVLGEMSEYGVDVMGVPVLQGNETLYLVLMPAGVELSPNTTIEMLATSHPAFRTGQGVGPGMTLAEAASIYGQPTLSYNVNDESREYARFPALSPSYLVRVAPGSDLYGGFYETTDEYNETARYDPTATIAMIMVRR